MDKIFSIKKLPKMFISSKGIIQFILELFSKYFISPLTYWNFQKYFGNPSYYKFFIMIFSKYVIYVLNWDAHAKRIAFIWLVLELFISNIVLLGRKEPEGLGAILIFLGWKSLEDDHMCRFPSLRGGELKKPPILNQKDGS